MRLCVCECACVRVCVCACVQVRMKCRFIAGPLVVIMLPYMRSTSLTGSSYNDNHPVLMLESRPDRRGKEDANSLLARH